MENLWKYLAMCHDELEEEEERVRRIWKDANEGVQLTWDVQEEEEKKRETPIFNLDDLDNLDEDDEDDQLFFFGDDEEEDEE